MASNGFLTGLRASTSSLRPQVLHSTSAPIRQFASTSPTAVGKPILVELLKRVPELGEPGDRVHVPSGRARLRLVPARKARIVPFAAQFGFGPKKAEPKHKVEPVPVANNAAPQPKITPTAPITPTSDALFAKLAELPPVLDYNLQTMDANSNILLNTFTLADVQGSLDHLGLTSDLFIAKWKDGGSDRIERIGERVMIVQVRGKGMEQKQVSVRVHRTYDEVGSFEARRSSGDQAEGLDEDRAADDEADPIEDEPKEGEVDPRDTKV